VLCIGKNWEECLTLKNILKCYYVSFLGSSTNISFSHVAFQLKCVTGSQNTFQVGCSYGRWTYAMTLRELKPQWKNFRDTFQSLLSEPKTAQLVSVLEGNEYEAQRRHRPVSPESCYFPNVSSSSWLLYPCWRHSESWSNSCPEKFRQQEASSVRTLVEIWEKILNFELEQILPYTCSIPL
jgi:hypothetical protein